MAEIKAFFDPRTFTVTYVVWDPDTKDALAIDPVLDYDPNTSKTWTESVDALSAFIRTEGLKLRYVLETHAHADHLSASQLLKKRFDAKVVIGEAIALVQKTFKPIFDLGEGFATDGGQFDVLLKDGEKLQAGALNVEAIATPGHTPACLTYKIDDALFVGDAIFMEDYGTGRCDFPMGSAEALYESVQKLYRMPDSTRVFVGHDYQPGGRELRWETTIGKSKANNPQLRADTRKEEFVKMRTERDATLAAPRLLLPSVQVNIDAGRLPKPRANGQRYLNIPLDLGKPTDDCGDPV